MAPLLRGTPRPVDLTLILTSILLLVAWTLLGFLLGRVVPVALAVPVAAMVGFVGMAFPEATNAMAWRHVLALHSSCCLLDQEVSLSVLVGSLAFYLSLVGVLWWLVQRPSWPRAGLVVVVQTLVTGLCLWLVAPVTHPNGVHDRPTNQLVCQGQKPQICLWPEQERDRAVITDTARRIVEVLDEVGVTAPQALSSATAAEWSYQGGANPGSDTVVRRSVVMGAAAVPMPACALREPWHGPASFQDLAAWVWLAAGFNRADVTVSPTLAKILAQPLPQQDQWFATTMAARGVCGTKP
ncbi:DUF7224 domain-containing protein [Propionibacteriaceae bacterium G57]|uniref:DUF7224 domain-containing protein n=1 Tax=Aestuariimicrobium sp. G57 TaxID=3418485 RepID=UPI003DA6E834